MIEQINSIIDTPMNLVCISRPRRFGKSYAAQMLCAYYDRSVDSRDLFEPLYISASPDYQKHLNQYNVIYLDMTNLMGKTNPDDFIPFITNVITKEVLAEYNPTRKGQALDETLLDAVACSGHRFIMIIDEWDAPIREFNEAAVAEQIRAIHMETTNPLNANHEASLRAVIQVAYFAYKDYYLKSEELPTGNGYADIVYLPRQGKDVPALVVELKWNTSAAGAIAQIKEKHYPEVLQDYGGRILLVGISYSKETRDYACNIEEWI